MPKNIERMARTALQAAQSALEPAGEALMQLSRARRVIVFGTVLLMVGIAGQAAAGTPNPAAPPTGRIKAHSVAVAPKPSKSPTAKPKPKKKPGVRTVSGPAGSKIYTGDKTVALTFDDGPDPAHTPQILKLLRQQHVKATFCLVGKNVERHPELTRRIAAEGHTLCNHTWNHDLKLGKKPAAKIRADLERTNRAILKAVPGAKIKYFRAPGGNFTPRLVAQATGQGMESIYWKVDPRDWDHPKGETPATHRTKVVNRIKKHVCAGAIVLSHDYAQPDTIAAYRTLLPWLRKRYELVALPV